MIGLILLTYGSSWTQGDPLPTNDPRRRFYFYRQSWQTPGNFAIIDHSSYGPVVWPDDFWWR